MSVFSCNLVGEGIVAVRCLEVLVQTGAVVRAVYSADGSLRRAAEQAGIVHASSLQTFKELLASRSYDYLFSINNGWIIPPEVIATAGKAAINYHDSPLPKYAGLHATSWALIHGETSHAVSFHTITSTIDGGELWKQRAVAIEAGDTAFSLNMRCYEAACEAFAELARELATGTAQPYPQPERTRSYFGLTDRPAAACTLSFRERASDLCNLVRALDFGHAKNPLGLPKLYVGSQFIAVTRLTIDRELSTEKPGRVIAVTRDGITVSTCTHNVLLSGFRSLSGEAISAADVSKNFGLVPRVVLPEIDAFKDEVTEFNARIVKFENRWAQRLTTLNPFQHPYLGSPNKQRALKRFSLSELPQAAAREQLAWFAAYCSRLSSDAVFDVGLHSPAQKSPEPKLFAAVVPLRVQAPRESRYCDFSAELHRELDACRRAGSYALDLPARYPALRERPLKALNVVLVELPSPAALEPEVLSAELVLAAYEDGSPPELVHWGSLESWQEQAILQQLCGLARVALATPEATIAELSIISGAERRQLGEWNDTHVPYARECIHTLIAQQARRTPDAPAVRFNGISLSYAELEVRSNAVAQRLIAAGVRPRSLVPLCVERSFDVIVGMLAILKAGAAYVPIDPAYPMARIHHILDDCAAKLVVTESKLRERFTLIANTLLMDECRATEADDRAFEPPSSDAGDLAYVIYTSGSTGKPKGVEIEHHSLVNHSSAIGRNYQLGKGSRMLCSASIGFDVAAEQIWPALLSGAEVVIRPDDLFESFTRFGEFVAREEITAMVLPTAFWHEWVRELESARGEVPPALRVLSVGTEKALGAELATWQDLSRGRVRFFQGYGPTETTITCTMYVHDNSCFEAMRDIPIGRPLPNVRAYVLDERLEPVPIGVPGELYIGGVGLARGYHNNPELTRERFIADPFLKGERLYRTGDLVRSQPDGQLVYIGRTDFQVKIRGYRVELGDIESTLRKHPDVADAVVMLRMDYDQPQLVAYVVAADGTTNSLNTQALRTFAAEKLPEYMVPASFVRLAEFPKTTNQKVDRNALPIPPRPKAEAAVAMPTNALERDLVKLWSELLGNSSVGISDDFYAAGGNSLLAVRLLSQVEKTYGIAVPLSAFSRAPKIAELAKRLTNPDDSEESLVVRIAEGDGREPLWVVHPVGGHVVYAEWLRRHMSTEQPIYGIQARGLDGKHMPLCSIEQMAERYLSLILETQPSGPYLLAGPSMGGLIALEIAQRLLNAGKTVALLALLDTWGPAYPRPTSRIVRLSDQFQKLKTMPISSAYGKVKAKLKDPRRDHPSRRVMPPLYDALAGVTDGKLLAAIERVARANEAANEAYVPKSYAGPIVLLRAERTMAWSGMRFDDPNNGWGPLAKGGLKTISLPCSHVELVDNPPSAVGAALQSEIDQALKGSRPMINSAFEGPTSQVSFAELS